MFWDHIVFMTLISSGVGGGTRLLSYSVRVKSKTNLLWLEKLWFNANYRHKFVIKTWKKSTGIKKLMLLDQLHLSSLSKPSSLGGAVSIIRILGGAGGPQPDFLEILKNACVVRGILHGTRDQYEEMNHFLDTKGLNPVVDPKVWKLEELKDAYKHLVSEITFFFCEAS